MEKQLNVAVDLFWIVAIFQGVKKSCEKDRPRERSLQCRNTGFQHAKCSDMFCSRHQHKSFLQPPNDYVNLQ